MHHFCCELVAAAVVGSLKQSLECWTLGDELTIHSLWETTDYYTFVTPTRSNPQSGK